MPSKEIITDNNINSLSEELKKLFYQKIHVGKYYFNLNGQEVYLSCREYECIAQIMSGMTVKQTGKHLKLSDSTVKSYLKNFKSRMRCATLQEALEKLKLQKNF